MRRRGLRVDDFSFLDIVIGVILRRGARMGRVRPRLG
jgi:hypothetical protein